MVELVGSEQFVHEGKVLVVQDFLDETIASFTRRMPALIRLSQCDEPIRNLADHGRPSGQLPDNGRPEWRG